MRHVYQIADCGCCCALIMPTQLIDHTTTPYADHATANAALAAHTSNCLVEYSLVGTGSVPHATIANTSLHVTDSIDMGAGDTERMIIWKATVSAAVQLDYSVTTGTGMVLVLDIWHANGATPPIEAQQANIAAGAATGSLSVNVAAAGCYFVGVYYNFDSPMPTGTAVSTFDFSSSNVITMANIYASYTNGATTENQLCL